MAGNSSRKLLFIVLCASMLSMATPAEAFSARIALKSALAKIKKFASLDYLLHCDCPKHKKNQTLKNQIRRHPERVGIYLAAGAGLLLASYKLFTSSRGDSIAPQPPQPPMPPAPANPIVVPVNPAPVVAPIVPVPGPEPVNPIRSPEPVRPLIPIIPDPARPRPQPVQIELIEIENPIEHQAKTVQIQIAPPANPSVRPQALQIELIDIEAPREDQAQEIQVAPSSSLAQVVIPHSAPNRGLAISFIPNQPLNLRPIRIVNLGETEAIEADREYQATILQFPTDEDSPVFSLSQTKKPESPAPTEEESPCIIPDKDKDEADPADSNSATSSFVLINNNNNSIKSSLSQPLQDLINLGLKDIPSTNTLDDREELLLLGAACNHALITNNEEVINILAQDHPHAVRALIWYYYALAAGKEQTFEEGTFLIVHPRAQAIIDFLNRNPHTQFISFEFLNYKITFPSWFSVPEGYERISSHFGKFMELNDEHEQHYGLDIDDLPTAKQTILFGHVDKNENMIFIKPESHGTFSIKDYVAHGASYLVSLGVKIIAAVTSGPSHDDDPKFRKERIPVAMLRSFNILTQELLNRDKISPDQANHLNATARARGIAFMHEEVTRMIPEFAFDPVIQAQALELINEMSPYDHKNHRFGREVILAKRELEAFVTQDDFHSIIRRNFNF
jgi:hypothetical protein